MRPITLSPSLNKHSSFSGMAAVPAADASPPDAQPTSAPELRADMTTVEVVEYMQRFQLADGSKIFTNYTSGLERVVVAAQLFDHVKEVGVQPRAPDRRTAAADMRGQLQLREQ